jgi:hypothetical protein
MTPEDRMRNLGSSDPSTPSESDWTAFRAAAHKSLARRRMSAVVAGAGVLLAIVGGAYAVTSNDDSRRPDIVGTPTDSPSPTTRTNPWPDERVSQPLNQWYIETDGKLTPFHLYVGGKLSPRRLLEWTVGFVPGPLAETGVETAIPEGADLEDLTLSGGTAYISVNGPFPKDAERRMAYAQIVYTLTQFDEVENVFVVWHTDTETMPGARETRDDYSDLLPQIVVEEPYLVQEVGRTFTLKGMANVFEATVSYRLVEKDGNVIKEGFTTATCGTGCWGEFEERIRYPGDAKEFTLQVFESSAEDGSPLHLVEIPLRFVDTGTEGVTP